MISGSSDGSITHLRRNPYGTPNSIMLSMLLDKYKAAGSEKVIALFQKISPVAWQHIHFLGHYTFRDNKHIIDLETMLANITLE